MSARVPPSSGLPPARTTSWTAERWTGASSASWPHPAPCRCCCFRRWTTTAFPTVACSPRSPEACAGGAVTGLRTVDRASSVAFDLTFAWFCTGASFVGESEPYVSACVLRTSRAGPCPGYAGRPRGRQVPEGRLDRR